MNYIFILFNMFLINCILAGSMRGHIRGWYHGMHLGATVSCSMKREWECVLWHNCSERGYLLSVPTRHMWKHSHQTEHDIIRASCDDIRHHIMMSWWCGGFWMMIFTSVLRGVYKGECMRGKGSKLRVQRIKIYNPLVLRCVTAVGLQGNSINGKIKC